MKKHRLLMTSDNAQKCHDGRTWDEYPEVTA